MDEKTSTNDRDSFQAIIPTKNKPALLSYYFGVFGLIPILGLGFSVAAIITGLFGLKKFKITPTPGAKGHALTGIVLGIVELTIFAILVLLIVLT